MNLKNKKNKKGGDKKRHLRLVVKQIAEKLSNKEGECQSGSQGCRLLVEVSALKRPPEKGDVSWQR